MSISLEKWIAEYEGSFEGNSIGFKGSSGQWKEDDTPRFKTISPRLQDRGYLLLDELKEISRWKAGKRNDSNIESNTQEEVKEQTRDAFDASSETEALSALIELGGVRVPVASSILTVVYPSEYAIIDFRALRALGAVKPQLVDGNNYSEFATFLDHFRGYHNNTAAYSFYLQQVRDIANTEELTAREVDMALWAYDKKNA
jgi:hypothetical protein